MKTKLFPLLLLSLVMGCYIPEANYYHYMERARHPIKRLPPPVAQMTIARNMKVEGGVVPLSPPIHRSIPIVPGDTITVWGYVEATEPIFSAELYFDDCLTSNWAPMATDGGTRIAMIEFSLEHPPFWNEGPHQIRLVIRTVTGKSFETYCTVTCVNKGKN